MDSNCIFCKIIKGEIKGDIVYKDDLIIGIKDINPQAPLHLLILPKKHIAQISDLSHQDKTLISDLVQIAKDLAKARNVEDGYRLVINNGARAGQSVFHIHLHLLAGRSMAWPPG